MRKSISYKSKVCCFMAAVIMSLAFLFVNGCGNETGSKQDSSNGNQSASGQEQSVGEQNTGQEQNQPADGQEQNAGEQNQPTDGQEQNAGEQNQPTDGQEQNAGQEQNPGEQQTQAGSQGNSVNQSGIGMEEAKEAALKHAGLTAEEAVFVKEEMDYEDGRTEYELEFVSGTTRYKYEISGEDGAVLESSQEAIEQIPGNIQGVISVEEAKAAVLSHAGFAADQAAFTKIELEQEHGRSEYEIDFYAEGREYSSKVDAVTGAILEYEID